MRARWPRDIAWSIQNTPMIIGIFILGLVLTFTFRLDTSDLFTIGFGATVFVMVISMMALFPTKYQVFSDRIRIVCGYVFRFDIRFSNIENVAAVTFADLWGLNFNFINSYSSDDILRITRKRGAKVHITPWNRTPFFEHLNKAMAEWRRYNAR